jgi:hypothetical protein
MIVSASSKRERVLSLLPPEEMIGDPDGVETQVLDAPGQRTQLMPTLGRGHLTAVVNPL